MIPTAEDFFNKYRNRYQFEEGPSEYLIDIEDFQTAMIEFAKLHVEAALKAASEDADMDNEYYQSVQEGTSGRIDIETILNAYPLTNIK